MLLSQLKPTRVMDIKDLQDLMLPTPGPCISIYMPTEMAFNNQNTVRLRNLIRAAEEELTGDFPGLRGIESLLHDLQALETNHTFWRQRKGGLALFRSPLIFRHFHLLVELPELAVVANSFHVKPLIRVVQNAHRYQVLCISQRNVALFEGNRYQLERIELKDVPSDMNQIGVTDPEQAAQRTSEDIWHDAHNFRQIDLLVWDQHSRRSNLPLILVGLPENQSLFRDVSDNPFLVERGIVRDPFKDMSDFELCKLAWEIVEPVIEQRKQEIVDTFHHAKAHNHATDDLLQIARDATQGRVMALLTEAERHIGGHIDPGTGELVREDIRDAAVDDVLDDLAEMVLRNDGQVLVLPRERMPTKSGAAAIERW